MKKILPVTGSMQKGGAERVLSNIANSLDKYEVYIILLLNNQIDYNLNSNIKIFDCSKKGNYYKNVVYWITQLRKIIKEIQPHTILSFIGRVNIITIISCFRIKTHLVVSERNDPINDGRKKWLLKLTDLLYRKADLIIFQTEYARSCFSNKTVNKKSCIIPNPVDIKVLKNYNSLHNPNKIITIGRLERQKNQKLLIDIFVKLHKSFPNMFLEIYGDGSLYDELSNQINRLGAEEYIFLKGKVDDIFNYIHDARLFVLPSLYEGFSNALIEAMGLGILCLSSDCAGSREIIKDGVNGFLFKNNDEFELYNKLKEILEMSTTDEVVANANHSLEKYYSGNIIEKWQLALFPQKEGIDY